MQRNKGQKTGLVLLWIVLENKIFSHCSFATGIVAIIIIVKLPKIQSFLHSESQFPQIHLNCYYQRMFLIGSFERNWQKQETCSALAEMSIILSISCYLKIYILGHLRLYRHLYQINVSILSISWQLNVRAVRSAPKSALPSSAQTIKCAAAPFFKSPSRWHPRDFTPT